MTLATALKYSLDKTLETARRIRRLKGQLGEISKLVNDPKLSRTYYPEEERKSKRSIWIDNLVWTLKNSEVNKYYYVYGMDRKQFPREREVLPYNKFNKIRNARNMKSGQASVYDYVCILRDKFVFSQYLKSLGIPSPLNIALFRSNEITWLDDRRRTKLEYLIENTDLNIDGFCKELSGILGKGAFPLRIANGKLFVKGEEISLHNLSNRLTGQYLFQEKIEQHSQMRELHPDSVNTIRVITFFIDGKVEVFCASLRIGAHGSNVDNWAAGGIVVGIDMETGKLIGDGLFKPGYGGRVKEHPNSGILLDGFQIPFFHECVKVVSELHGYLYGIHSIGWDVAITPNGPIVIEGNDDWEGGIPMSLEPNFRSRFLKYYTE